MLVQTCGDCVVRSPDVLCAVKMCDDRIMCRRAGSPNPSVSGVQCRNGPAQLDHERRAQCCHHRLPLPRHRQHHQLMAPRPGAGRPGPAHGGGEEARRRTRVHTDSSTSVGSVMSDLLG